MFHARHRPRAATRLVHATVVVCALGFGCQTTRAAVPSTRTVMVDGEEIPAETLAQRLLDEGNAAAQAHDDTKALAAFDRILAELQDTSARAPAVVGSARLLLEQGKPADAQARLEKLLTDDPTSPQVDEARYLLALAQLHQGDARSATPTLKTLVDKLPESEKPAALVNLAHQLAAAGQGAEAARYLSRAVESSARTDPQRTMLEAELEHLIDSGVAFADVRLLLETEAKPGTLLQELVLAKLARVHVHLRDYPAAMAAAKRYLKESPGGRYAAATQELLRVLEARVDVDPKAVGVLLPLTGEYAAYGKRALTAIKLGFGAPAKADAPPPEPVLDPNTGEETEPAPVPKKDRNLEETIVTPAGIKLIVRDTKGQPARAAQLAKDLVEQQRVLVLVGDILLDTALPIALAAEEATVPMLSLSRKEGVPEAGPWSFRLALTARKQARALAHYAIDGAGMKRFAIVYPKFAFGVELMNAFWSELEERKAEVTAVESYAYDQTTFTAEAKSLVGRGMAGSADVAQCRSEAAKIDNDYRRRKVMEGCSDLAKPVVDFEALFIPDSARAVSYIIPALVAEDVLVTRDRRTVETYRKTTGNNAVRPVQLLGVSMWNDAELGKRLGKTIDGAVFVDGFDATDGTSKVQRFLNQFGAVHSGRPALVEAQAFDGASLVSALLVGENGKAAPKTRAEMRDAIERTKDFPGVTGLITFDDTGDSTTPPRFFVMDGDEIEGRDEAQLLKGDG